MTNTPIPAWLGDVELKERVIAEVVEHRRIDAIVQGSYATKFGDDAALEYKGCALGCALMPKMDKNELSKILNEGRGFSWHEEAEKRIGMPIPLAYVYEGI